MYKDPFSFQGWVDWAAFCPIKSSPEAVCLSHSFPTFVKLHNNLLLYTLQCHILPTKVALRVVSSYQLVSHAAIQGLWGELTLI
jgi:hypothetical protein